MRCRVQCYMWPEEEYINSCESLVVSFYSFSVCSCSPQGFGLPNAIFGIRHLCNLFGETAEWPNAWRSAKPYYLVLSFEKKKS